MSSPRNARYFICLFLVLATLAAYWQLGGFGFIQGYDDEDYVYGNHYVRAGLTRDSISWAFAAHITSNWHPLTWMSHMVDCQLFGIHAPSHHLMNLLIHIVNALLLFLVLSRMTGSEWRSGFVAALFALHPLHVESVAWIAERKDVLSTFFWMLTMLAYAGYARGGNRTRYLLVMITLALGLMAKPMLVTLPIVLLLLDYWPLGQIQTNRARVVLDKAPLLALAALSSVITFIVQRGGGSVGSFELYPPGVRVANALVACVSYLVKMVWPMNLSAFYPHPGASLPSWQVIGAGLLLISMTVLAVRCARSRPYVLVGWLWYLVTMIPVIGLVQVGDQAMADRYTYVPLIGVFIMIAWGIPDLLSIRAGKTKPVVLLSVMASVAILASMALTVRQVGYWSDNETLWRHALASTSDNWFAHLNVGAALDQRGDIEGAMDQFTSALRIRPNYPEAYYNLGLCLDKLGRTDEAIPDYQRAIKLKPDYAQAHNNLAVAHYIAGNYAEAWREAMLAEKNGVEPNPEFLQALSAKQPEPAE